MGGEGPAFPTLALISCPCSLCLTYRRTHRWLLRHHDHQGFHDCAVRAYRTLNSELQDFLDRSGLSASPLAGGEGAPAEVKTSPEIGEKTEGKITPEVGEKAEEEGKTTSKRRREKGKGEKA